MTIRNPFEDDKGMPEPAYRKIDISGVGPVDSSTIETLLDAYLSGLSSHLDFFLSETKQVRDWGSKRCRLNIYMNYKLGEGNEKKFELFSLDYDGENIRQTPSDKQELLTQNYTFPEYINKGDIQRVNARGLSECVLQYLEAGNFGYDTSKISSLGFEVYLQDNLLNYHLIKMENDLTKNEEDVTKYQISQK